MNQKKTQAAQDARQQAREEIRETAASGCPSCGFGNQQDAAFCENCGAPLSVSGKECPECGEITAGTWCEFCGANLEGIRCGKCGSLQHSAFCSSCGEPLSEQAVILAKSPPPAEARQMSREEAQQIMSELQSSLSPKMLKEQENKRQRIILLRERDYSAKRQLRIDEHNAASTQRNPGRMKEIREGVRKLKERISEKTRRIEHERREKRIEGVWIATSGTISCVMKLDNSGGALTGSAHWIEPELERVDRLEGSWNGNAVLIKTTSIHTIYIRPDWKNVPFTYASTVNESGDTMSGCIDSAEHWQEIFIKQ